METLCRREQIASLIAFRYEREHSVVEEKAWFSDFSSLPDSSSPNPPLHLRLSKNLSQEAS